MIDIYEGVRDFLRADADVVSVLEGGVYVGELNGVEVAVMPRRTAVIVPAGGLENRSFVALSNVRMDIWCYGASYYDCATLDRVIAAALAALNRVVVSNVLLHTAAYMGGPWMARDGETDWPVVHRSYVVTAAEVAAT